ncbi:uncharacterized protein LOC129221363 [Uloborus diversus]|uniref:uncharacterized protein LOC129221363 n=1 Tax=Uloborus diversus TaxID=327109 RepID=UPI00240A65AD|nr:uncharacterized protein LOC129221363 [Uloborus diversus]
MEDNSAEIEYPVFRSKRTSQHQYEVMVAFLENHPELTIGKTTDSFTKADRHRLWQELADTLNKFPGGPRKSNQQWRKTWNDLKCSARAKAIGNKRQHTENGSKTEHLTPLEKKVLTMSKFNVRDEKPNLVNTDSNLMDVQSNDAPNGKDNMSSDSDAQNESGLPDIMNNLQQWPSMDNIEIEENLLTNHTSDSATELQNNNLHNDSLHDGDTIDIKPSIAHLAETVVNGDISQNAGSREIAGNVKSSNPVENTERNDLDNDIDAFFNSRFKNESNKSKENNDTARRTVAVEGLTFLEKEKSKALSRIAEAKEQLLLLEQKKLDLSREHLEIKRKKLELSREQYYLNERIAVAEENKAKAFSIVAEILRSKYNL